MSHFVGVAFAAPDGRESNPQPSDAGDNKFSGSDGVAAYRGGRQVAAVIQFNEVELLSPI